MAPRRQSVGRCNKNQRRVQPMNTFSKWLTALALCCAWSLAMANQVTYNVAFTEEVTLTSGDDVAGYSNYGMAMDTVTGVITTDGNTGNLGFSDITNYSLTDSLLGVSVNGAALNSCCGST